MWHEVTQGQHMSTLCRNISPWKIPDSAIIMYSNYYFAESNMNLAVEKILGLLCETSMCGHFSIDRFFFFSTLIPSIRRLVLAIDYRQSAAKLTLLFSACMGNMQTSNNSVVHPSIRQGSWPLIFPVMQDSPNYVLWHQAFYQLLYVS